MTTNPRRTLHAIWQSSSGQLTCPRPNATAVLSALPILSSQLMTSLLFSPRGWGWREGNRRESSHSPRTAVLLWCAPPPVSGNGLSPPPGLRPEPPPCAGAVPSLRLGTSRSASVLAPPPPFRSVRGRALHVVIQSSIRTEERQWGASVRSVCAVLSN